MVLYPEVQTRAQTEIDSINWDDRASMPYIMINAIMLEMLRWFPVAPWLAWSLTMDLDVAHATVNDDIYKGYYIPKGATVTPNAW
ncbi:cytochrome P450 [Suillus variegatus]|nr:cytochrome P450 [Suillus variegatus]